jgi:FKBP-type peptidyl-prolyl cis-trans isomerase
MKKIAVYAAIGLLLAAGPTEAEEQAAELKTETQKFSYAFGLDFGNFLKGQSEEFDLGMIQQGVKDAYTPGAKPLMTLEEVKAVQDAFGQKLQGKFAAKLEENKGAAKKFLEENKGKEGVKTTATGLQYKIVKEGAGAKPTATDEVKVHYRGKLMDGTEFDSSYKRNEPAQFPVNQVIPGWTEALQLMSVGSSFELYLPPELGYGDRGAPPVIKPGSLLIFEVELLEIVKRAENPPKEAEAKKP